MTKFNKKNWDFTIFLYIRNGLIFRYDRKFWMKIDPYHAVEFKTKAILYFPTYINVWGETKIE